MLPSHILREEAVSDIPKFAVFASKDLLEIRKLFVLSFVSAFLIVSGSRWST